MSWRSIHCAKNREQDGQDVAVMHADEIAKRNAARCWTQRSSESDILGDLDLDITLVAGFYNKM